MTTTRTEQELAAPLGSVDVGRLVFTRGVSNVTIGVGASMEDLTGPSSTGAQARLGGLRDLEPLIRPASPNFAVGDEAGVRDQPSKRSR